MSKGNRGRFKPGHKLNEGKVYTAQHREAIRQAALLRSTKLYPKVSVMGVVYPNITKAAEAAGVSVRALRGYANSTAVIFNHIFFVDAVSTEPKDCTHAVTTAPSH